MIEEDDSESYEPHFIVNFLHTKGKVFPLRAERDDAVSGRGHLGAADRVRG